MQKCSKKQQTKKTEQKMVLYLDNVTSPSLLYFAFSLTPQLILLFSSDPSHHHATRTTPEYSLASSQQGNTE